MTISRSQMIKSIEELKRTSTNKNIKDFDTNKSNARLYRFYKKYCFPNRRDIHKKNPHIMQNLNPRCFTHTRKLNSKMCRCKYKNPRIKSLVHCDAVKSLLCEIEFLTNFATSGDIVIYAGEISTALPILFKELNFYKYGEVNKEDVLFLSNLKYPSRRNRKNLQLEIQKINRIQEKMFRKISPRKALLNFILPWRIENKWITEGGQYFNYLQGDIYFQPWNKSSDVKILVDKNACNINYDNILFEEQMVYFNNVYRSSYFHSREYDGMDHCYDCVTEIKILEKYLLKKYGLIGKKRFYELRNLVYIGVK